MNRGAEMSCRLEGRRCVLPSLRFAYCQFRSFFKEKDPALRLGKLQRAALTNFLGMLRFCCSIQKWAFSDPAAWAGEKKRKTKAVQVATDMNNYKAYPLGKVP
ncbi:MAG: hypothetical protein B5M55_05970 [Desulfococcus sp. 4484_242]|nr:MAG: hypothetical protein B5M55_05970 [Desulfococcus sp. 4484_242]